MTDEFDAFLASLRKPLADRPAESNDPIDDDAADDFGIPEFDDVDDPLSDDAVDEYLDTYGADAHQVVDNWELNGFGFDLPLP